MAPDRAKAFTAGADDYLSKPVFIEDLEAALSRLLSSDENASGDVAAADLRRDGPTTAPIFDTSIVEELRKIGTPGKLDLFSDLAGRFLDQIPASLDEIRSAVSRGDAETVTRLAHKLLGVCRQIGAERMARVCAELESIDAISESSDEIREIELLHEEFNTARRELQDRYLS
jgi:HPt (histidine-containing phosphotransfer) domain-containing protein